VPAVSPVVSAEALMEVETLRARVAALTRDSDAGTTDTHNNMASHSHAE
jgi:hypothetical protein